MDAARVRERECTTALERARTAGERIAALVSAELAARHALTQADRRRQEAAEGPRKAAAKAEERRRFVAQRRVDDLGPAALRRYEAALRIIAGRRDELQAALAGLPDRDAVVRELTTAREAREDAARVVREVSGADQAVATARAGYDVAARELQRWREARKSDLAAAERQAGLLGRVPCTSESEWRAQSAGVPIRVIDLAGTCPLLADARGAAARVQDLQAETALERSAAAHVVTATDALANATRRREALPAEAPDPTEYDAVIEADRAALARIEAAGPLRQQLAGIDAERTAASWTLQEETEAATRAVHEAAEQLDAIAADLDAETAAAGDALQEAQAALATARTAHEAAEADLARERDAGSVTVSSAEGALAVAAANARDAESQARVADHALALLRGRVEALTGKQAALDQAAAEIATIQTDLGDWSLLAQGLGKDGVQALEVDAAAPEVAGLVNELLASCYGTRFSVTLETLREKRDGGYQEVFDLLVYDGGQVRPVEALSGGERVVVGEAVGLAIAILNARRNAIKWGTLFRDETAGALDPENAGRYVQMLRRARELGGFAQVLFVAHQPEVSEAADVRLVVEGGRVMVERQEVAA